MSLVPKTDWINVHDVKYLKTKLTDTHFAINGTINAPHPFNDPCQPAISVQLLWQKREQAWRAINRVHGHQNKFPHHHKRAHDTNIHHSNILDHLCHYLVLISTIYIAVNLHKMILHEPFKLPSLLQRGNTTPNNQELRNVTNQMLFLAPY